MANSYLNDEYTRMVVRIFENIESAKNMYDNLPSIIKQSENELTQFNNTLGTSLRKSGRTRKCNDRRRFTDFFNKST